MEGPTVSIEEPAIQLSDTAGVHSTTPGSPLDVFFVALRLGLTSFGGPIAHLGYFREEYVVRRRWLDDHDYGDLIGLCQFLPGPASSQVGMAIGLRRAGVLGGLAAWLGFTLPSALLMIGFAYGVQHQTNLDAGWIHGLLLVAVAVVAQAIWGMARKFCLTRLTQTIAVLAAVATLVWTAGIGQMVILAVAGLIGWRLTRGTAAPIGGEVEPAPVGRGLAIGALLAFFGLLVALPIAQAASGAHLAALTWGFYRVGALVFGGGHVILPLLRATVVDRGWVSPDQFIAGYGAAQALPGPLSTFAAYLGAVEGPRPNDWLGGGIATIAIFLPSFLLIVGAMPFWGTLRRRPDLQAAMRGVNAGVVGLLLAALYTPIWTSAVKDSSDFAFAAAAFGLLMFWKLPSWMIVVLGAAGGILLQRF
jgi:chromate transporter